MYGVVERKAKIGDRRELEHAAEIDAASQLLTGEFRKLVKIPGKRLSIPLANLCGRSHSVGAMIGCEVERARNDAGIKAVLGRDDVPSQFHSASRIWVGTVVRAGSGDGFDHRACDLMLVLDGR